MEKTEIYKSIVKGTAILLTGSGAHLNVKTPNGDTFPSGVHLANTLYKACGICNPENSWDLQDAADTYVEKFSEESLIQEIKKQLLVGSVLEEHNELYSCNWQRVYTTNYDEVPRIATSKNVNTLIPITLSTPRREKDLKENLCIYINGYIGKLTNETLKSEFKLTGRSYLSAGELKRSEWGAVFADDIETADCIIVIGLSLDYDLELKQFIYNKKVCDKTVFIESPNISEDKRRKLERIGQVESMGMSQFVSELVQFKKSYNIEESTSDNIVYKSFYVYEPKINLKESTAFQVYDLFMSGKMAENLWYRKEGKYTSLIYRRKLREVTNNIRNGCRVIYLHANLGNGKTLFLESLKHQIQHDKFKIFTLKDSYQGSTSKEVKRIVEEPGKKIVVIENYYNYLSVIKSFSVHNLENVQFIFSARSVIYDTRLAEVNEMLNIKAGESSIYDLNKLADGELSEMTKILDINGLWGSYSKLSNSEKRKLLKLREKGNKELQAILVGILNSTSMKNRIESIISEIKSMSGVYYDVLILALLIRTMSLNISANDMSRILEVNIALDTKFVNNEGVREILDFSSGETEFKLRSAVTAKMILQELDCNEEIIKILSRTAKFANQYSQIERYENVLKNIISYSHVKTFLMNTNQKERFLLNYYDGLKELDYYKENSFYWLQYSIACINSNRYNLAQTYLDNAYSWFRDTDEIVPFQIDTQQARLYLLLIERKKAIDVADNFQRAHELLMKPVVSSKDNPAKQINVFRFYLKRSIQEQVIKHGCEKLYKISCGDAYNKVNQYLKSVRDDEDREGFKELERGLLRASVK